MSLLRKLNPFYRATPDEQLAQWVVDLETRREKAERKWRTENSMAPYLSREWATPGDIEKLTLILEAGADVDQQMAERNSKPGTSLSEHYPVRTMLDAVLFVSSKGAQLMMQHGAKPKQNTVTVLSNIALDYCQTHTNGKVGLGHLNARLPDPAFEYQDIALDLIKVEGLHWYHTHQCDGSGRNSMISSMAALRKAFFKSRSDIHFQEALEQEQAKRGWMIGHPPMAQWIARPGRAVQANDATRMLAETIEQKDDLLYSERIARIQELIDLGADPNTKIDDFWRRDEVKTSLIGVSILDRDWAVVHLLSKAGASINWDVCDRMASKWIARALITLNTDSSDAKDTRWRIGDLLRAVGQCEIIDWERPFPYYKETGTSLLHRNATWPATWGAVVEMCGGQLREEIEQTCLRGTTAQVQATSGRRRL